MYALPSLCLAAALSLISVHSMAAVNDNAATYGQWRNQDRVRLTLNANGIQQYADDAAACRPIGYSMVKQTYSGSTLIAAMHTTARTSREQLAAWQASDHHDTNEEFVRNNVARIPKLLTLIDPKQSYSGIAVTCGTNSTDFVFINHKLALERTIGAGDAYFDLYEKAP